MKAEVWRLQLHSLAANLRNAQLAFPDRTQPVPVLIEVESYPDRETEEQVFRDVATVFLERRILPEVVTVVLHPKGTYRLPDEQTVRSPRGSTELRLRWRVIELWNVDAEVLRSAQEVGLMLWVPLTRSNRPPEVILQLCQERIEQHAPPQEQQNMLAVAQVMTLFRYNDAGLAQLLGGGRILMEIPIIQEIIDERVRVSKQADIIDFLEDRFGTVPEVLAAQIRTINDMDALKKLLRRAASCSDLEAFRLSLAS